MRLMILAKADVRRKVPAAGRYQLNHLFEFRWKKSETLSDFLANLLDNLQP